MDREEAEATWMAWQLGYEANKAKVVTAILVLGEEEDE